MIESESSSWSQLCVFFNQTIDSKWLVKRWDCSKPKYLLRWICKVVLEQNTPIPKIFGIRTVSKILFSQGFSGHQVVYKTKKGIKLQFNAAETIKYEGGKT